MGSRKYRRFNSSISVASNSAESTACRLATPSRIASAFLRSSLYAIGIVISSQRYGNSFV